MKHFITQLQKGFRKFGSNLSQHLGFTPAPSYWLLIPVKKDEIKKWY